MNKRLFLILFAGLALRLAGISFGLPHLYHADEPIVVNHALAYGAGDLNPHFFNIPPLTSYLLFICYGVFFLIGKIMGQFQTVLDFEKLFYSDPSSFYLIARVTFGALIGTASIAVLHRLIRKHFTRLHADIAAFLFAIYFLHVRDSHYIYADIPLLFAMLCGLCFILKTVEAPTLRHCFLSGLWIGIAIAFKYNGAVLWIPFVFSLLASKPKSVFKKLLLSALSCALAFFLLNPYALLDSSFFLKEIAEQGASQNGAGWIHHFQYSLIGSAGFPMLAAALCGLLHIFQRKDLKRTALAVFLAVYYIVLVFKGQPYDRYVLPLVPVIALFAADFILSASYAKEGVRKGILILLLTGVSIPSLTRCFIWISVMRAPDVRTEAKSWIEKNIPPGETIAMDWDFFMPRLSMSKNQLLAKKQKAAENPNFSKIQLRRLNQMIERAESGIPQYELYSFSDTEQPAPGFLLEKPKIPYDLDALKARGVEYAVIGAYAGIAHPFYAKLRDQGKLIAEFSPYKTNIPAAALDPQPLTGGPFLLQDLKARKSNGQPLQVYKIQ